MKPYQKLKFRKMNKNLLLFLSAGYLIAENKFMLHTRHEYFGDDIKIAHISDVHKRRFGKDNCRICRLVCHENPDIILITGDLVSRTETDFSVIEKMLANLCKIAPVYMIYGNHERTLPAELKKEFFHMIKLHRCRITQKQFGRNQNQGTAVTYFRSERKLQGL